jgi:hypothetical protein
LSRRRISSRAGAGSDSCSNTSEQYTRSKRVERERQLDHVSRGERGVGPRRTRPRHNRPAMRRRDCGDPVPTVARGCAANAVTTGNGL